MPSIGLTCWASLPQAHFAKDNGSAPVLPDHLLADSSKNRRQPDERIADWCLLALYDRANFGNVVGQLADTKLGGLLLEVVSLIWRYAPVEVLLDLDRTMTRLLQM